jgi:hypothetical protein
MILIVVPMAGMVAMTFILHVFAASCWAARGVLYSRRPILVVARG